MVLKHAGVQKKNLKLYKKIRSKRLKTSYACLLFCPTLQVHFSAIHTSIKLTLLCIFYCTHIIICCLGTRNVRVIPDSVRVNNHGKRFDYNILIDECRVNMGHIYSANVSLNYCKYRTSCF